MLRFEGYLSDFVMEYDVDKSIEYLELVAESKKPQEVPVYTPPVNELPPPPVETEVKTIVETPIIPA